MTNSGRKDIAGERFGMLLVLSYAFTNKNRKAVWLCQCDCGNKAHVAGSKLRQGSTQSCGCLKKRALQKMAFRHGQHKTRLYEIWSGMKKRCYNKNAVQYKDWGGRGIKVCKKWHAFKAFYEWAKANGYKDGLTIERINNDRGYSPNNCTFIPKAKQSRNRRNSIFLTHNGTTRTIAGWSRHLNIHRETIKRRINLNWPIEKILTTAPKTQPKKGVVA